MRDIITPSIRYIGNSEAAFIEPYAQRKQRREAENPRLAKLKKRQGRRHDPAFREAFCRLYRAGTKAAHIAAEMRIARNSVWRFAKFYGLRPRHDPSIGMGREGGIAVCTRVNDAMDREITAFCRARNVTRAAWLRKLIRNNLDSKA